MPTRARTALDSYKIEKRMAESKLKKIQAFMDKYEFAHWGSVGDMQHINESLDRIMEGWGE